MQDTMQTFRQGIDAGYTLAVDDLRGAVETGEVSKKNREGVALLERLALDAADRWLEEEALTNVDQVRP